MRVDLSGEPVSRARVRLNATRPDRSVPPAARRWQIGWRMVVLAVVLTVALGPASPPAVAAERYKTERLFGQDYVDARDFARRFGLTPQWIQSARKLRLKSAWTTIELARDSSEARLNNLRIFLGSPVVARDGTLYLGRGDAESILGPILSPGSSGRPPALRTIVIDPGHGGNDPGNQNPRLKLTEKIYTLDVARRLERLLKAQGYKVVLTRTTDRRVELEDRAALARRAGADLFISIHFNAFTSSRVGGTETFVLTPRGERSSPQAERDRGMMRANYPGNRSDPWNILFGYHMHRQLVQHLKREDRGLKRFRYKVLTLVDCPAVLVEAAFLSNDAEGRQVANAAYRQRIADALAAGVKSYAARVAQVRNGN